jgi:hypothetical protein
MSINDTHGSMPTITNEPISLQSDQSVLKFSRETDRTRLFERNKRILTIINHLLSHSQNMTTSKHIIVRAKNLHPLLT